jgi:hypothetical protein
MRHTGNTVYVACHADARYSTIHSLATCRHSDMNHSAGKTTEGASPGVESAVSCVQTSGGQLRGRSAS